MFFTVLKPVVLKIKIIINKSNEARVPKLLVDFVLQDAALQMSRKQFVALMETAEFMKLAEINRSVNCNLSKLLLSLVANLKTLIEIPYMVYYNFLHVKSCKIVTSDYSRIMISVNLMYLFLYR